MPLAKRLHPSDPDHYSVETETTVWILIVILVGLACFTFFSLLHRVVG